MFQKAGTSTGGIVIIFIILLAGLFLCQTLGKLIMWLIAKFRYTAFNGKELIEELSAKNHLEGTKVKVNKFDLRSSFYSYNMKKKEFTISESVAKHDTLVADLFGLETVAYAKEKNIHSLATRWQFIGVGLLSIVPYLLLIGIMLLIYLPNGGNGIQHDWKYYVPVEVLTVIGWIVILICLFWWMSITQNLELNIEELTKQMDNKNLLGNVQGWMRYASYIPFSFRTII